MKTIIIFLFIISGFSYSQILILKEPPQLRKFSPSDSTLTPEWRYLINCTFDTITENQLVNIKNINNWSILSENNKHYSYIINSDQYDEKWIFLEGDFDPADGLQLIYLGDSKGKQQVPVIVDSSLSLFKAGNGKGVNLGIRRIASENFLFAADYKANLDILGTYGYQSNLNNFYFQSYTVNLKSSGTFTNSISTVPNYTQTSLDISAIPYLNTNLMIYRNEIHIGYQLETKSGASYFDIINKSLKIGAILEIPYTNYPMYYLTQKTHYLRLVMPVILKFDYLPKGTDAHGNSTLSRIDLGAVYELAFSPYLILKGEWNYSKFINTPAGFENTKNYTAVTFGQDLKVLKEYLGILKLILGDDQTENKNFIYYKIESGSKAPDFLPVSQQSFGFGMYF
jgi:hypothetical protein